MSNSDNVNKEFWHHRAKARFDNFWISDVYGKLLCLLIGLCLTVAAIHTSQIGVIMGDAFVFMVSFVIAHAFFRHHKNIYAIYIFIALVASGLDAVSLLLFRSTEQAEFGSVSALCFAALQLTAILVITRRLNRKSVVTLDMVRGGICVYLLIAILWYLFYVIIDTTHPGSFNFARPRTGRYDYLYFSFCTITTVGYGDIVPTHRLAMALCNIEAMIGQMFPAVFLARLVSLYVVSKSAEQDLIE
jgi:hypothetical protein